MLKKNDTLQLDIIRTGMDGEGVAEVDGLIVFVPGALVGERVRARVLSVKRSFAYAKVEEYVRVSPDRVTPTCSVFSKCGGCDLSYASYHAQLKIKRAKIASALRRVPGMDKIDISMVGSDKVTGYRNKISLPVRKVDGRLRLGFFAPRSHRFVPHDCCELHGDELNGLATAMLGAMDEIGLSAYDEETCTGYVRHLVIRELEYAYSVTVVVNDVSLDVLRPLVGKVSKWNGRQVVLYANVNTKPTNVIFGDKFVRLQGNTPKGKMCGVEFELHPAGFLQVNTPLAEKIFERVNAELEDTDFLVDAYSGIGITSNVFAHKVQRVFSVEIVSEAVENAKALARANGNEDKIECICGDCRTVIPAVIDRIRGMGAMSVFLDPPRKGCDDATLDAVLSAGADKIIYLSCNPATLARDLAVLTEGGYNVTSVTGYDLFPQTKHVETVVLLSRKDVYERIKFDVNVEDLQGRASSTATYSEIKAYILEKFGLKVSSLYIAQIKDKCGFEKRDNYNIGEGKSKELICPPEKEQAIMDAFRHFGMLRD